MLGYNVLLLAMLLSAGVSGMTADGIWGEAAQPQEPQANAGGPLLGQFPGQSNLPYMGFSLPGQAIAFPQAEEEVKSPALVRDPYQMVHCKLEEAKQCYHKVSDALGGPQNLLSMKQFLNPFNKLFWKNPNVTDLCENLHPNRTELSVAGECFENKTALCPAFVPLQQLKALLNVSLIDTFMQLYCHQACHNLSEGVAMMKHCEQSVDEYLLESLSNATTESLPEPLHESLSNTSTEPVTTAATLTNTTVPPTPSMQPNTLLSCRRLQLVADCRMYEAHGCPGLVEHASLTVQHNIPGCTIILNPHAVFPPTGTAAATTEQSTPQAGNQGGNQGSDQGNPGNTGNPNTLQDHGQGLSNLLMVHTSRGNSGARLSVALLGIVTAQLMFANHI